MIVKKAGEFNGKRVDEVRLESTKGVIVDIMTYGVVVRDWQVPVGDKLRHVVLGFDDFAPYPEHSPHFGSLAGRVGNRISNSQFELNGKTYHLPPNEGANHLHGGPEGLGMQIWNLETDTAANRAVFTHESPDGAMGYPGNVKFVATYQLSDYALDLTLKAFPDCETPISLLQHQYFNLGTDNGVLDHRLRLAADRFTKPSPELMPTGEIVSVEGTQYDFRNFKTMRDANSAPIPYDLNLVLNEGNCFNDVAAELEGPDGALRLKLWTDRKGVQLYNGVWTDTKVPGINGKIYGKHSGLCLEDQAYPNSINQPNFPSIVRSPDDPYHHRCRIEIAPI